jgi:hypothetical protein
MPDRNQYGDPLQTGEKGKDMTMTRESMECLSESIIGDLRRVMDISW